MWPWRPKAERQRDGQILELAQQVQWLTNKLKAAEETLAALEHKHEQLRGRFYASKRPDQAPTGTPTKGQILAQAGFVAGRPFQHKE